MAVDAAGRIYVVDHLNCRIQKFERFRHLPHGRGGRKGFSSGQFNQPSGIAIDAAGNVYVADTYNHRIQKFAPVSTQWSVANFSASAMSGTVPLTVTFTDTSTGSPTSWLWTFGDGATSTEQHPVHTYTLPGNHTVTLSVDDNFSTAARPGYIQVTPVLFGDANEDGAINQADTLTILQEVVGLREKPPADTNRFRKTDTHANGAIEIGDALFIAQHNVGLRDIWFEAI